MEPRPPIKAQGTWRHLTANIWEWLAAQVLLAAHHRVQHPEGGKKNSQVGARVWVLGMCTSVHTSRSSPVSVVKHILQTGQFIMLQMKLGGLDVASRINPNSAVWMKG